MRFQIRALCQPLRSAALDADSCQHNLPTCSDWSGTYSGLTNVTAVPSLAGVRQLRLEGNVTGSAQDVMLGSVHMHSFSVGPFPLGLAIINIKIEELHIFGHTEQGAAVWSLIEITDSIVGRSHGPGLIVTGKMHASEISGMVISLSTILGGLSFEPTNHDELGLLVISGSKLSSGNVTLGGRQLGGWHVSLTHFDGNDKVTFLNSAQIGDSTTAGRAQFENVNLVEFLGGVFVFGADAMGGGGVVAAGYYLRMRTSIESTQFQRLLISRKRATRALLCDATLPTAQTALPGPLW